MSVRPYRDIHRRQCRKIHVGKVPVGGDAPITVQSMTNTVTSDVGATVAQVRALEEAGADIVRISCPDQESALALKEIVQQVTVPIVADIHFHYKRAIETALVEGDGRATVDVVGHAAVSVSREFRCPRCDVALARPQPVLFSFNHPLGACPECKGFGNILRYDETLVVRDSSRSLGEGAVE